MGLRLAVKCKVCKGCSEERGLDDFYSDKRAKDGKQSRCKDCHKAFYKTDRGKAVKKKSYCPTKRSERYLEDKDSVLAKSRQYYRENKEARLASGKKHYQSNKHLYNSYVRQRQARIISATIALTQEQKEQIKEFYWLAKDLQAVSGEVYHVDHIVPLKGENICGLHVPWNLQILPADINLSKGNRYADDA